MSTDLVYIPPFLFFVFVFVYIYIHIRKDKYVEIPPLSFLVFLCAHSSRIRAVESKYHLVSRFLFLVFILRKSEEWRITLNSTPPRFLVCCFLCNILIFVFVSCIYVRKAENK